MTTIETPDSLLKERPSEEPALAPETGAPPSEVERWEIALIRRHTELKGALPELTAARARAIEDRAVAVAEMAVIERLLRAHKRLREPVRRKR